MPIFVDLARAFSFRFTAYFSISGARIQHKRTAICLTIRYAADSFYRLSAVADAGYLNLIYTPGYY